MDLPGSMAGNGRGPAAVETPPESAGGDPVCSAAGGGVREFSRSPRLSLWIPALLCCLVTGCGLWHGPRDGKSGRSDPAPRPAPRSSSVVLAVIVMEYRDHERGMIEQLWGESDQLAIGTECRQAMDANGIRAAVLPSQITGSLGGLLATGLPMAADAMPDLIDELDSGDEATRSRLQGMRMHFQPGAMREVPVSGAFAMVDWALHGAGRVTPGFAANSRAAVQVTVDPEGSREGVRMEILPGFREQHAQPVFGAGNSDLELGSRQIFHPLDELGLEVRLRKGQTLILGSVRDVDSSRLPPALGELFFADNRAAGWSGLRRLLLIRLVSVPGQ